MDKKEIKQYIMGTMAAMNSLSVNGRQNIAVMNKCFDTLQFICDAIDNEPESQSAE